MLGSQNKSWKPVRLVLLLVAVIMLASCRSLFDYSNPGIARQAIEEESARRQAEYDAKRAQAQQKETDKKELATALESKFGAAGEGEEEGEDEREAQRYPGTGEFIQPVKPPETAKSVGEITLNFENTDVREVVKVILSDMLELNYILDPRVKGGVTMQTATPLSRAALLPTLETLLRMNGAAIVEVAGTYHVVPVTNAVKGRLTPQLGDIARPLPQGYGVRVVPLKYISVSEMTKILEPFAPEGSIVRADSVRNILLLAGTSPELGNLVDTVRVFDVDWMEGLSVAFFPLHYSSLEDIQTDLNLVFGDQAEGPLAGMLRMVPIESANGLLVVTPQEKYLKEVETWIERFDRLGGGLGGASERLYVYRVRNGQAVDIAALLNELFGGQEQPSARRQAELAPGARPATIESANNDENKAAPLRRASPIPSGGPGQLTSKVQFVADEKNNSLLIMATPPDYEKVLAALKQLDVPPLQVLVEATILEIVLSDQLEYGIQWFFKSQLPGGGNTTQFGLNENPFNPEDLGSLPFASGFNWQLLTSGGQIRAALNVFAGEGLVKVLSSPSVMVLDNRSARIQVGDEVPVATSQQQQTDVTSTLVNNIEYRDTGVVLEVTPRVNPGGLVTMEIAQDVSNAIETENSTLDSPTIQTRNITSTVAVQNGQTVVLGGLIRDETSDTRGGVPGLYNVPIIGDLFGSTDKSSRRTELVVILTPSVISSDKDIEQVTEDFRSRLKGLKGKF